jgi:hypothetical protein
MIYVLCFLVNAITTCTAGSLLFDTIPEILKIPGNFPKKPDGRNFREFREIFSGDSREFRKSPGTFSEIQGVFLRTRAVVQCTRR